MMPKITHDPRKAAGLKGVDAGQPPKTAFDPAKMKTLRGPAQGKHLVQGAKRLQVPGKGRAR
jgi:hypothetical protein